MPLNFQRCLQHTWDASNTVEIPHTPLKNFQPMEVPPTCLRYLQVTRDTSSLSGKASIHLKYLQPTEDTSNPLIPQKCFTSVTGPTFIESGVDVIDGEFIAAPRYFVLVQLSRRRVQVTNERPNKTRPRSSLISCRLCHPNRILAVVFSPVVLRAVHGVLSPLRPPWCLEEIETLTHSTLYVYIYYDT